MEQPGHWRHYFWLAGLLVAACTGVYAGGLEHLYLKSATPIALAIAGLASLSLATVAILPARGSRFAKLLGYLATTILYAVASYALYCVAGLGNGGLGAG
jgi:hypothetical protein